MSQLVIISVDRSDPEKVIANTSVDSLHCRITMQKTALKKLGYYVYRPQVLKPFIKQLVDRQMARHNGKLPLGGILLTEDDLEALTPNPD